MAQDFAKAFYNSDLWKQVRLSILKRDCYMCQMNGCSNPAEEVHHIKKLTPSNINDPMVSVNQNNLISLCGSCHKLIHKADKAAGIRKKNSRSAQKILPDIIFDENGYPVPVK